MNLHLLEDEKFSIGAAKQFEEYFPEENIYIINADIESVKYAKLEGFKNVFYIKLFKASNIYYIDKLVLEYNIDKLFIHYLTPLKALISERLRMNRKIKTYWIFFGAELYIQLYKDFNFDLFDESSTYGSKIINSFENKFTDTLVDVWSLLFFRKIVSRSIRKFFKNVDFFCFWNENDYLLLRKYYNTSAKFKQFIYYKAVAFNDFSNEIEKTNIIVNHAASQFGNHFTIIDKIRKIDPTGQNKIIIPLSYGIKDIKDDIVDTVKRKEIPNVVLIDNYLDLDSYTNLLQSSKVAIYGMKRQEAAGNIFMLLFYGAKVFLRNDNNLLLYFRDRGFKVFSFEDDLSNFHDLEGLEKKDMNNNKDLILKIFEKRNIDDMMKKLLNEE